MRGTVCFLGFVSSRRRHTRGSRDWSSDVCSSDLPCMERVPGVPCIGRPCGALGAAARGGGAVYTGRGPVCGVIILLCCAIGWPGTGLGEGRAAGVPCGAADRKRIVEGKSVD